MHDRLAWGLWQRRQQLLVGKPSTITATMWACAKLGRDPATAAPGLPARPEDTLLRMCLDLVRPLPAPSQDTASGAHTATASACAQLGRDPFMIAPRQPARPEGPAVPVPQSALCRHGRHSVLRGAHHILLCLLALANRPLIQSGM